MIARRAVAYCGTIPKMQQIASGICVAITGASPKPVDALQPKPSEVDHGKLRRLASPWPIRKQNIFFNSFRRNHFYEMNISHPPMKISPANTHRFQSSPLTRFATGMHRKLNIKKLTISAD
jgi:hypothetical protein